MSFSTLGIGASSLYAAQRAAEVAAHNVANAGTEGYTKQRLQVTSGVPTAGTAGLRGDGMRGTGVRLLSIDRLRDQLSDLAYRAESGGAGSATVQAQVLERAQGVLGAYPDGAPAALDRFWSAWDQLSLTPTDPSARTGVLSAGGQVASALNAAAAQLERLSQDTGSRMQEQVREVNDLATHVAGLNQAIADAVTAGQSPNDLRDQRDVAIDRLARLAGATVRPVENSMVDVYVGNSVIVAGVGTRELTATLVTEVDEQTGEPRQYYGVGFVTGRASVGGELGGYARAVSSTIPSFARELDALAQTLADAVNAVHGAGHTLDSPRPDDPAYAGPDGGDFFTTSTASGRFTAATLRVREDLAADGRLVAASATGSPFDGNAAIDLAALRSSGTPSLGDLLRGIGSRLGAEGANAAREAAAAESALSGADALRSAANGVNVDEEMVDLVRFQHAWSAAARVISMADSFYDTIINRMGAGR